MSRGLFLSRGGQLGRPRGAGERSDARHGYRRASFEPLEDRRLLSVGMDAGQPMAETGLLPDGAFARFTSDTELEQYLVSDALTRYKDLFGQPVHYWWRSWDAYVNGPEALAGTNSGAAADGAVPVAPDHSGTNVQVDGVDEGDIVETDGSHLYVLSDQELVVLKSWPAAETQVVSRLTLTGRPVAEYLHGDRLTVLSEEGGYWIDPPMLQPGTALRMPQWSWTPKVTVTVIDVSQAETPRVVQNTELEGASVASRAIDNHVYLVMRNSFVLPGPELIPVENGSAPEEGRILPVTDNPSAPALLDGSWNYVYETQEQYLARLAGTVLDLALPHYTSLDPDGQTVETGQTVSATDVYRPRAPEDTNLMSVVTFDMTSEDPGPASSVGVPSSNVSVVYASLESIYLMDTQWSAVGESTSIMKLDRSAAGDQVGLSAVGAAPGRLLNQFSADEHQGDLRIATTSGWGPQATSGVYVLRQDGAKLDVIGRLEGLAPGEQLYSARFEEDYGFLVSFLRIDPLWVIDLRDPLAPKVSGELEIPGFSEYLHVIPGGYLVGIGRNADPATGAWMEPQVSLFDIADPSNPRLLDQFAIHVGDWGWSEAFSDHHAVAYYPEEQVLTLSVTSSGRWVETPEGWGEYLPPGTSLYVLKIATDTAAGSAADARGGQIGLLGTVVHDSPVRRTVRIEGFLYSVSSDTVSVHEMLKPENEIVRVYYGNQMDDLGPIDFEQVDGIELAPADPWYAVEATLDGTLTVEALAAGGLVQAHLSLYDEQLRPLADSGSQRIDLAASAGAKYYVRVSAMAGTSPLGGPVALRLANLVSQDGPEWTVTGTDGDDQFILDASAGAATVNGIPYAFTPAEVNSFVLEGKGGNDTYGLAVRNTTVRIVDTAGTDQLDFSNAPRGVSLDLGLADGQLQQIGAGRNRLMLQGTIENVLGTAFNDQIYGNAVKNILRGGAGDDVLAGLGGPDWLYGGPGNDRISGNLGNDTVTGGAGDDWLDGGRGRDAIYGGIGDDLLFGTIGDDWLDGGSGANLLNTHARVASTTSAALAGNTAPETAAGSPSQDALLAEIYGLFSAPGQNSGNTQSGKATGTAADADRLFAGLGVWAL